MKIYILLAFCVGLAFVGGFAIADEAITFPNPLGNVNDFPTLIQNVATYITVIVGALAVLMFIWAGLLFITAAMFPGNYEKGKNALWWAMIGLIIALSAMGLIQVVRQVLGGGSNNNPPAPTWGACCTPADACYIAGTEAGCTSEGNVFKGVGMPCGDNTCP